MIAVVAFFLLALIAECLALIAFSYGFIRGKCRAAYERGYTRGYDREETQVVVEDND